MVRKIIVSVFIILSSTAVSAQQFLTTTAANGSVAADVWNGSGLIDFYIPDTVKNTLSSPQHSYLTVDVNGAYYTNNPNLLTDAYPFYTPPYLKNGSSQLLKDMSGSTNDTIRTTWTIANLVTIIQNVYPVDFIYGTAGQIVYKVSVVNLQNKALSVQAEYLLDNDISSSSPQYSNDNDTLATRYGYSPTQTTFIYPDIPPFELAFENGLGSSSNFLGIIGVGFTNDSLAPEPMGLMAPAAYAFVDWDSTAQNFTWGFSSYSLYKDAATMILWPAFSALDGLELEIARSSYGVPECGMWAGRINAIVFHPEHIVWNPVTRTLSPNPFKVEMLVFNTDTVDKPFQVTQSSSDGQIHIISPYDSTGGGHSQNQFYYQVPFFADIMWTDSTEPGDEFPYRDYDLEFDLSSPAFPNGLLVGKKCDVIVDSPSPYLTVTTSLTRTGSSDSSECNARCTDVRLIDTGADQHGFKAVTPDSLSNMHLTVTPFVKSGDTVSFSVCVADSLLDGFATIIAGDSLGGYSAYEQPIGYDTLQFSYCTLPDTAPPYITWDTVTGGLNLQAHDDHPWDRGLDSIAVSGVVNTDFSPALNAFAKGSATFSIIAQPHDPAKLSSYCIQAFDRVGHTSQQYCFTTSALGVMSEVIPAISLSVFPDPINGIATMILDGAEWANVEIFDVLGREVDRFQVSGSYDWQTSGLPSGTYILRASIGGEILNKRIIKE